MYIHNEGTVQTGILFPADPAGVVTVGVAPLADAEPVTMAVADLTDGGMLFPADPAGVVTVGVAPLADAGSVTMVVADLTDAGILFSVDPAGVVTVGVAPPAVLAGDVAVRVALPAVARAASLADAGILFPADPAGVVTIGVAPLADAGMVTVGVTWPMLGRRPYPMLAYCSQPTLV